MIFVEEDRDYGFPVNLQGNEMEKNDYVQEVNESDYVEDKNVNSQDNFILGSQDCLEDGENSLIYEADIMDAIFLDTDENSSDDVSFSDQNESDNEQIQDVEFDSKQDEVSEIPQLREWIKKKNIHLDAVDELLVILRQRLLPTLPKCGKTFLKTADAKYNLIQMEDSNQEMGEFVYFGIATALQDCVNVDLHEDKILQLLFNIDGITMTKSGINDMWVILGKVFFDPDVYEVFPIAIFYGKTKPNLEQFLEAFVNENNKFLKEGIKISNIHFEYQIKAFICDTPARAYLKNIMGHKSHNGCERCEIEGTSVERTSVFPLTNQRKRTDYRFRKRKDHKHHHGPSPLEKITPIINMIKIFLLDFMHLCCLGVMKRILEYLLAGDKNVRLSVSEREELSRRMNVLYTQIPSEFQRKSRSTKHAAKWKAVEYRFFLLYCGPVIMKKLVRIDLLQHFLLFHTACRILCCKTLSILYTERAKEYLTSFFIAMKDFYGDKSQVLNSHYLIHLADDVRRMKCCLSQLTAFPFESYLGKLKTLIRTSYRPLQQICRRLYEQNFSFKRPCLPPLYEILSRRQGSILKIKYKQVSFSCFPPNNAILLDNNLIFTINSMFETPEGIQIEGHTWKKIKPIFTYPFDSGKYMNMWELRNKSRNKVKTITLSSVKNKLLKFSLSFDKNNDQERVFVIPFLH